MDGPVVLGREAARRVARAVRAFELEGGGPPDRKGRGPRLQRPSKLVRITTAVPPFGTAGTGAYGQGVGTLLVLEADPTTGHVTEVDSGVSVKVYSRDTAGTPAGRVCQVKVIDEFFLIDVDYCA